MSLKTVGTFSKGIVKIPFLSEYVNAKVLSGGRFSFYKKELGAIVGWGRKKNAQKSQRYAQKRQLPYWALEDGFLRSYGTGDYFPTLSLVVDEVGIYYDSTAPSALENLLQSTKNLLIGREKEVFRAIKLIKKHQLSKYNHAPDFDISYLRKEDTTRVLVVDQTVGDMSVSLGNASQDTFFEMLESARKAYPHATIYIKTHPEVSSGRKKGYLSQIHPDEKTVILNSPLNPLTLLQHMDRVYVVTSQLGFEALLLNKKVIVFGMPWYAGWGLTDDRQTCTRRTQKRSVDELFAAAYLHYSRYLNPYTHQLGTIFDVIDWLVLQKQTIKRLGILEADTSLSVGLSSRKTKVLTSFLSLKIPKIKKISRMNPQRVGGVINDNIICWGGYPPDWIQKTKTQLIKVEDGFIRSVGLGSNFVRPMSLSIDKKGIYFDPTTTSDLEDILNTQALSHKILERARNVREFIVKNGITKYNTEPLMPVQWNNQDRKIILIPGQVEDDASIRLGCREIKTNLELIKVVRKDNPGAYLVYKQHPDVTSGNRRGKLHQSAVKKYVDFIEISASIVSCIEAADEVHTMTSLSGFDALLRDKKVVVYGIPFYAGWGLTEDKMNADLYLKRRSRQCSLDELVAGVLLSYPYYYDWDLNGYTSCEAILRRIASSRQLS